MLQRKKQNIQGIVSSHRTIRVATMNRRYTLVVPAVQQKTAPLLLVFHGSNQNGDTVRRASGHVFDALVQEHGCVVAYLDGYKGHWNDARLSLNFAARKANIDDVLFVRTLIDALRAERDIDATRVYLAGYSNGGEMVIRLLHEWPYPFAGATLISATQPDATNLPPSSTQEHALPVLLFHGMADPLVPYNGGMVSLWGFNPRGLSLSAHETVQYYARRNHITAEPTTRTLNATGKNALDVTFEEYAEAGKYPVTLVTLLGGGHTIPNPGYRAPFLLGKTAMNINSATLMWDFFQRR